MEIDTISTHDAKSIKRLIDNGEPLSTTAAGFGYTPVEAQILLDQLKLHHHVCVGWFKTPEDTKDK